VFIITTTTLSLSGSWSGCVAMISCQNLNRFSGVSVVMVQASSRTLVTVMRLVLPGRYRGAFMFLSDRRDVRSGIIRHSSRQRRLSHAIHTPTHAIFSRHFAGG
jgi:hypothetical protein